MVFRGLTFRRLLSHPFVVDDVVRPLDVSRGSRGVVALGTQPQRHGPAWEVDGRRAAGRRAGLGFEGRCRGCGCSRGGRLRASGRCGRHCEGAPEREVRG